MSDTSVSVPEDVVIEGVPKPAGLFDSLLACIKPESDTFEITLSTGHVMHFRHVYGSDAFDQIRTAAHEFYEATSGTKCHKNLIMFKDVNRETKVWCYIMAKMCIDEDAKVDRFLELQHYGVLIYQALLTKFKLKLVHAMDVNEWAAIEQAKKKLNSPSSGETASPSPKKSGTAIQDS